ncbi:MAG: type II/IV secretion system protein [Burkholderiales bacterium]|nr:type II/IV secretion system protein [Burkholderiales bacterium]
MNAPVPSPVAPLAEPGQRLTLKLVLRELVASDWIKSSEADGVYKLIRQQTRELHPLSAIAETRTRASAGSKAGQMMTGDLLAEWLSQRVGLDYFHIDPLRVDFTRIADVMSSAYATRYGILPVEVRQNEILIATCEPYVDSWVAEISQVTRKPIRRVISNPADITRYIVEFYNLAKSVKGANKIGVGSQQNFEQLVHLGNQLASGGRSIDQNDAHIVQIVDWLWLYAFEQRASDIHLEPRRDAGHVRFRIDGVLHQVYQVPPTVIAAMTARIKLLGRMDVVEKRRPQDGRVKTKNPGGQEIELRLSTLPTAFGEKLVMRIFDPEVLVKDFTQLGFSEEDIARWQTMTSQPNGIILVTGPTGSGKTTTLYSTLKQLATEEVNVCTVEDPIEMVEPSFNQMQIQHGIELSFADGLRALMRQDPDIIMVGEIRDLETAEMATQAALTGHLVLSTLHTNDAPSAVSRLLELGVPPYLLNATLLGVMAQRLVRTLCSHCKLPDEQAPKRQLWDDMIRPFTADPPAHFYKPVGCLECRMTGYRGRHGIYESLLMTDDMRRLVHSSPDISAIRRLAMKQGMKTLRVSGAAKIAAGITTLEEVLKAAPSADDLTVT